MFEAAEETTEAVAAAVPVVAAAVVVLAVAVVLAAAVAVATLRCQDLKLTEVTFSTDGTLFLQPHLRAGAATWWSACCIAQRALQGACREARDGPAKERRERAISTGQNIKVSTSNRRTNGQEKDRSPRSKKSETRARG